MPIQDTTTYHALANVLQSTFGKSSDQKKYAPHTHFLSMTVVADNLVKINYMTIVNYGHDQVRLDLRHMHLNEALEVMRAAMKRVADEYKDFVAQKQEYSGLSQHPYVDMPKKTISLKLLDSMVTDSYEIINCNAYNSKKTAYFRVQAMAEYK